MIPKIFIQSELTSEQKETVRLIWNNEYPERIKKATPADFDTYLEQLSHTTHFLVYDESNNICGWAMTFQRDETPWFAMILDASLHRKGIGSQLLHTLKSSTSHLLGWVIDHTTERKANGELYASPMDFYVKNGFTVNTEIRLETPIISAVQIEWREI